MSEQDKGGGMPAATRRWWQETREHVLRHPSVLMLYLSSLVLVIATGVFLFYLFQPFPVRSVEVVRVEPPDQTVDRSKNGRLTIIRRVSMRYAATIQITRVWVDDGGGVTSALDDWQAMEAGTHERVPIHVMAPASLNKGWHRYRVTLRHCNPVQCRQMQLEDIDVRVIGDTPDNQRTPQSARF